MKSKPSEKKQTVKLRVDNDIRFRLVGISCHENDYRLVWAINNRMKMQFVRTSNLVVHNLKLKTDVEFSRFAYLDDSRYLAYYLIANRCPDGFLFPEIKNFDFLIQIVGEMNDHETRELTKKIKGVGVVSAVFILTPEKLKNSRQILQE